MHFMGEFDAKKTMEYISGGAGCDRISKNTLKNWVVNDFSTLLPSLFLILVSSLHLFCVPVDLFSPRNFLN